MRLPLATLLIPLTLMAGPALAADEPKDIAVAFCAARLRNDEAATFKLLSASLLKVITEAEARNKTIADAQPDEKPPFGDGIPYQSFQDQASDCQVGDIADVSGHKEVDVKYSIAGSPGADWTDRLEIVADPDGWRIDDILFVEVAKGVSDQGLRRVLFDAFDQ